MKTLLLLICIIATLGLQVPADNIKRPAMTMSVCTGKNGVMVSMPGSCSGFFFCIDGQAIASSCGPFYHFNSRLSICDHPDQALCNEQISSMLEVATDAKANEVCALATEDYVFGKTNSYTLFYVCRQKLAVRRACPPQKHFNVEAKLCQDVDHDVFDTPVEFVTLPTMHVSLSAPTVPYAATSLGGPIHAKKPIQADYSKISFSPASVCSGRKDKTTVAHPWDCRKFVYCIKQHPMVMECPKDLHFSSQRQRCEWPTIAECKLKL